MKYLHVSDAGDVELLETEPTQEDLGNVDNGYLEILKLEVKDGEVAVQKATATLNEAEGDAEEDEYELGWKSL